MGSLVRTVAALVVAVGAVALGAFVGRPPGVAAVATALFVVVLIAVATLYGVRRGGRRTAYW